MCKIINNNLFKIHGTTSGMRCAHHKLTSYPLCYPVSVLILHINVHCNTNIHMYRYSCRLELYQLFQCFLCTPFDFDLNYPLTLFSFSRSKSKSKEFIKQHIFYIHTFYTYIHRIYTHSLARIEDCAVHSSAQLHYCSWQGAKWLD